jgi:poly-gamma-glutamate synthesis protein (capsule biosynthesis protein)
MTTRILCCGDIGPLIQSDGSLAEHVAPFLSKADIRFGQCERVYSSRGTLDPASTAVHARCPVEHASIFGEIGLDIVSLASNHTMDYGADALADTIALFKSQGIKVVGAGMNIAEARAPIIFKSGTQTIAFLAYSTVLRDGFEATVDSPGAAPLRARTWYEEFDFQAGVPPLTRSEVLPEDLDGMCADIAAANERADRVVVSIHWGVHYVPKLIAEYQAPAAQAAFDAGADAIIGSHAHAPKAIEMFGDKPCFYSLSNFLMTGIPKTGEKARLFQERYNVRLDPERPWLPYGMDAKRSLIAELSFTPDGLDAGFGIVRQT